MGAVPGTKSMGKSISRPGGEPGRSSGTHPGSPSLLVQPLISLCYYECHLHELDTRYNLLKYTSSSNGGITPEGARLRSP